MLTRISKSSTADKVIESLTDYIKNSGCKEGDKLPTEQMLCQQLEVGRSSIREALRVLQTMGLITIIHGKGAFVRSLTPSGESAEKWFTENIFALRDIYAVRKVIELLATELAAQNISPAQSEELTRIVEKTKRVVEESQGTAYPLTLARLDEQFHRCIFESSANTYLQQIGDHILHSLATYRLNSFSIPENQINVILPHERIALAIANHDAAMAVHEMQGHMRISEEDMWRASKHKAAKDAQ